MIKKKRILKLVFSCITVLLLFVQSGCYDSNEVNSFAYVTCIGIDRGVTDKWRVTLQFATSAYTQPSGGANGASGGASGAGSASGARFEYKTITIDAPSFFSAIEIANLNIPKEINLMHTQLIVFSEDVARSGFLNVIIAPIVRFANLRFSIKILVSKDSAQDFVNVLQPYSSNLISIEMRSFKDSSDEVSYFAVQDLFDFYDCLKSKYHEPIANYAAINVGDNFKKEGSPFSDGYKVPGDVYAGDLTRKGGNTIEIVGLAVFKGDRMVGRLTGHEARMLLIAKDRFKQGIILVQDPLRPDLAVPIRTRQTGRQLDIRFEGDRPVIHLKVELEGEIYAIQSGIGYDYDPELTRVLEKASEEFIRTEISKLVEKTQTLNADILKFGQSAVRNFSTIQQWEDYDWNSHYKDAAITAEVSFKIKRTGILHQTGPVKEYSAAGDN